MAAAYRAVFSDVRDKDGVKKHVHKGKVHTLGWNGSGSRLASGASDSIAYTYTMSSTKLVRSSSVTHRLPLYCVIM